MKLTIKRVRDIRAGLQMLGQEPIESHLLNFRLKISLMLLQPFVDGLQKEEEAILLQTCEKNTDGSIARHPNGVVKWLPDGEAKAVIALTEILDVEVEITGLSGLPWKLLEDTKCFYVNKETGARTKEPLVVSLAVQMLLDDFIEGEPSAATI